MSATAKPAERVTKKKLTVAEAAQQWVDADREIARLTALRKEAAPVLLEHFEKNGRRVYKDMVALKESPVRTVLDTEKIKAFLGAKIADFQTRTTPKPSLSRLE